MRRMSSSEREGCGVLLSAWGREGRPAQDLPSKRLPVARYGATVSLVTNFRPVSVSHGDINVPDFLIKIQLDDGDVALKIRLLIDRKAEIAVLDRAERARQQIVAARRDFLRGEAVLFRGQADAFGRSAVHGEHAVHVTMAEIVRFDRRVLLRHERAARHLIVGDALAGFFNRVDRAVDARLQVERTRRRDEERDVTARGHRIDDSLAHQLARGEEFLADVRHARVLTRRSRIRVVRNDGNACGDGLRHGPVEGRRIDEAHGDAVNFVVNRGLNGAHHLADVARLRPRPAIGAAEQIARVARSILRRGEKRIGRDVIDEGEFVISLGIASGGARITARCERQRDPARPR